MPANLFLHWAFDAWMDREFLPPPQAMGRAGVLRLPGCAFRPRETIGKYSRFTGFDLAVSPTAVMRMNAVVVGWRLHRHTDLTWEQLAGWIGPIIRGWMTYYGRFRHSVLDPLLARFTSTSTSGSGASTGSSSPTGP